MKSVGGNGMLPDNTAFLLYKFGEFKWMKKIQEGEISFACLGKFIDIAKRTGNNEQGDKDEGVFARLKKGNPKIEEMAIKLKDDLEIIEDGEYVKLRRQSSYYIPTFCFYSLKGSDLTTGIKQTGWQKVKHNFDENMYSGFSKDEVRNVLHPNFVPTTLIIQPAPFKHLLNIELLKQNIQFVIKHINYTEFKKEEFFIEPTPSRTELFYKFPKYEYQHETRICLINHPMNDIYKRLNFNIGPLLKEESFMLTEKFYSVLNTNIVSK